MNPVNVGTDDAALAAHAAADLPTQASAALHVVHAWQPLNVGTAVYPGMPAVDLRTESERDSRKETVLAVPTFGLLRFRERRDSGDNDPREGRMLPAVGHHRLQYSCSLL